MSHRLPVQTLVEQVAGAGRDHFEIDFDLGDAGFSDHRWQTQVERVGDDEISAKLAPLNR